jgi:transcriptional regulator
MYLPDHFSVSDSALIRDVMHAYPFALLICPDESGLPYATHVPLVAHDDASGLMLEGHVARANPHSGLLQAQQEVLIIFNGPDAYVSPSLYKTEMAVPTWNYVAVHAYGRPEIVDDRDGKNWLLEKLIDQHEPAYVEQWHGLPDEYRQKMLAAIVGFRIHVTRLEAKFKLSQNRPAEDRQRIYRTFSSAADEPHKELATWMRRLGI